MADFVLEIFDKGDETHLVQIQSQVGYEKGKLLYYKMGMKAEDVSFLEANMWEG